MIVGECICVYVRTYYVHVHTIMYIYMITHTCMAHTHTHTHTHTHNACTIAVVRLSFDPNSKDKRVRILYTHFLIALVTNVVVPTEYRGSCKHGIIQ